MIWKRDMEWVGFGKKLKEGKREIYNKYEIKFLLSFPLISFF